jgi:hypothetical protein
MASLPDYALVDQVEQLGAYLDTTARMSEAETGF